MIKKKIRRRRRKSGKKPYFGKDVHNSILTYQNTESTEERHKIYVNEILPAFNKLAENLIFIHGFAKSQNNYLVLKSDCVCFLYETLLKFDASRGTKAFSYFNVVAKNWLIIQSKKRTKELSRVVSLDDTDSLSASDINSIGAFSIEPSQGFEIIKKESMENLHRMMKVIKEKVKSDNDIACMNAIITLFNKIDDLELLNKRAVFLYMREISSLTPKQLSVSMSTIRKHYREMVKDDDFDIFFWR